MATETVNLSRRWLEPVPCIDGQPIPKSKWSTHRRHSWTVRWFGTTGVRYSKSFKTKKAAERFVHTVVTRMERGQQDRPRPILLRAFVLEHEQLMRGQMAYASWCDQMRALRFFEKFIGDSKPLQEIRSCDAEAFVADRLGSGLAVATVNKDIRTLKRIFALAAEPRGYLRAHQNPFRSIKQRRKAVKPLRYVSVAEYRDLMDVANPWWRAFIALAYGSGLRRGEILHLTWDDINLAARQVHIRPRRRSKGTIEWEPKDHQHRQVPMSDEAVRQLKILRDRGSADLLYVFVGPQRLARILELQEAGLWHSKCEVVCNRGDRFNRLRRAAEVAACTMHDLRRSAITNWARELPMDVVQQLAGHSDITTTRTYYLSVRPEDMLHAAETLNNILKRPVCQ